MALDKFLDNYNIKIGLEEEIFITNSKGFLISQSETLSSALITMLRENEELLKQARNYLFGLQWEPHPSQIEYVTRPVHPSRVKEIVTFARRILAKAAGSISAKIYTGSIHPVQSNPTPLNGTHISVSVFRKDKRRPTIKMIQYIHNHIRNHLPEIIALTANSPICDGEKLEIASARLHFSRVLTPSNFAVIKRMPISYVPVSYTHLTLPTTERV